MATENAKFNTFAQHIWEKGFEVIQNVKILKFVQGLGELLPEKSKDGEEQKILTSTFNIFWLQFPKTYIWREYLLSGCLPTQFVCSRNTF